MFVRNEEAAVVRRFRASPNGAPCADRRPPATPLVDGPSPGRPKVSDVPVRGPTDAALIIGRGPDPWPKAPRRRSIPGGGRKSGASSPVHPWPGRSSDRRPLESAGSPVRLQRFRAPDGLHWLEESRLRRAGRAGSPQLAKSGLIVRMGPFGYSVWAADGMRDRPPALGSPPAVSSGATPGKKLAPARLDVHVFPDQAPAHTLLPISKGL
jgi:hypothetical protein